MCCSLMLSQTLEKKIGLQQQNTSIVTWHKVHTGMTDCQFYAASLKYNENHQQGPIKKYDSLATAIHDPTINFWLSSHN